MVILLRALLVVVFGVALLGAGTPTPQPTPPSLPSCLKGVGDAHCFGPAEMRHVYGVDAVLRRGITGSGRTIAVIVSFGSPTIRQDLHAFDQAFGLPDPVLQIRAPLGTGESTRTGWEGETALDVEWAHVMAPSARILILTSPVDETEGVQGLPQFLSLERYAVTHGADVISQSWGATEDTLLDTKGRRLVAQFHTFYADATRQGVSFVAGSGDDGAAGRDLTISHLYSHRTVQWPAAEPNVLGVGGTRLIVDGSQRDEIAWPRSGGGFSKLYAEPSYQRGLPAAVQRQLHGRRGVPDVAYNAARESATPVYMNGVWHLVGGTSAGGPQWAGLIALADDMAGRRLGDVHAALYRLAGSRRYHTDLHDITQGSIVDPPNMQGKNTPLHAGPGWDPATGLGSPNAGALLSDLAAK